MTIEYLKLRGMDAEAFVEDLARLRIGVFHEFPYLYDGNLAYERRYLKTYFSCPESFVAICKVDSKIVGASTAIPLKFEEESFQAPFLERGLEPEQFMYFGESILEPSYRGLGVGRAFFDLRKAAAAEGGYTRSCFCAVIREDNHPMKPPGYKNLEGMWQKMGYKKEPGLLTTYKWKDRGQPHETKKTMQFWLSI